MTAEARHRSAAPSRRAVRGLTGAIALVAVAGLGAYAVPRLASHTQPATVSALALEAAAPTTYGVVNGGDQARAPRWGVDAEDVLGSSGVLAPRLEVVGATDPEAGPGAGSPAAPAAEPLAVLARAATGDADAPTAVARIAGIDAASGAIRWRGPVLGDVPDCAADADVIACAERSADAGSIVLLDRRDGHERARIPVAGRPARVSVQRGETYVVSATPTGGATRLDVSKLDRSGALAWTRADLAPAGSTPGSVVVAGDAVAVTGVAVARQELVVSAGDGSLAADRRVGMALPPSAGLRPIADAEDSWIAEPDGPRLAGTPVRPAARDSATAIPVLAQRFATGAPAGSLVAYADVRHAEPAWTLSGARPLAACGGRLVATLPGTSAATGTQLVALVPATGAIAWRVGVDAPPPTSAVCTANTVLVSGSGGSGSVAAYALATGATAWTSPATGLNPTDTEPARVLAHGPDVLVASQLASSARLDCLR